MELNIYRALFARDLAKLRNELTLYTNESTIWITDKHIANSGGNLVLHLIGNLNTYIGGGLGKTGYIRHRDLEFSSKDVPRESLIKQLDETIAIVDESLGKVSDAELNQEFPVVIWEHPTSMRFTIIHLLAHLNYHLGQINYHRRLLDA